MPFYIENCLRLAIGSFTYAKPSRSFRNQKLV